MFIEVKMETFLSQIGTNYPLEAIQDLEYQLAASKTVPEQDRCKALWSEIQQRFDDQLIQCQRRNATGNS